MTYNVVKSTVDFPKAPLSSDIYCTLIGVLMECEIVCPVTLFFGVKVVEVDYMLNLTLFSRVGVVERFDYWMIIGSEVV